MPIDDNLITYLEELSRLRLTEEEKTAARRDLGGILAYMERLSALDPEAMEEEGPEASGGCLRPDKRGPSLERDRLLANAPRKKDGYFVVPKVVEG